MNDDTGPHWVDDAAVAAHDAAAFARLVTRFESSSFGIALSRLGDRWLAEDVTQEAFIEAFLHLRELREPRAFPAWLRRIVLKHCDRQTRRRRLFAAPIGPESLPAQPTPEPFSLPGDPLSAQINALPSAQRQAVALAYLAGLDQADVAALLGVPVTAVKARLRRARNTLRRNLVEQETKRPTGAPAELPASPITRLFVALRNGDARTVAAMLAEDPALAGSEEDWDDEEGRRYRLGFGDHGSPLIRAIERDELAIVESLIAAGAPVDQVCGCKAAEPPLWTAAVHGRLRHVRALLAAGADPNITAFRAVSPLHIAAMRGDAEIVSELLRAGAVPSQDGGGRTPDDWARMNGNAPIAAGTSPEHRVQVIDSGIKVLDFFAPLSRDGLVRVSSQRGLGVSVLLAELSIRFARRHEWKVVWTGFEQLPADTGDIHHLLAESGAAKDVSVRLIDRNLEAGTRRTLLRRTVEAATAESPGRRLLVVFEEEGLLADTESLYGLLSKPGFLALVVSPITAGEAPGPIDAAPFSGTIAFDRAAARDGRFPAIDPANSRSTAAPVDGRASAAAREVLARPKTLVQLQLQAYLTQPFFGTEPFTGGPGAWVEPSTAASDVAKILAGGLGEQDPKALRYRGAL
jgi:RNA polymerase sigma factor (sigma-70 family)